MCYSRQSRSVGWVTALLEILSCFAKFLVSLSLRVFWGFQDCRAFLRAKAVNGFSLRVLAIAILFVPLSVTRVDRSKAVQARIFKSSPSAAWKTLVSKIVKLFS